MLTSLKKPRYLAIKQGNSCSSVNKKPRNKEIDNVLLKLFIPNLLLKTNRNKHINKGYNDKTFDDTDSILNFNTKNNEKKHKKKEVVKTKYFLLFIGSL